MLHRRGFLGTSALALAALSVDGSAFAVSDRHIPRSAPARQGVSAAGILEFLSAAELTGHELHGFMLARHGHVIAEGWWKPYRADAVHALFSLSKIFTSTAVGFAVVEGRLTPQDRVVSFFPERIPAGMSENLASLRVEHLLTMSVGHAEDSTPRITREVDWVKAFLAVPIVHPPGSEFLYDGGATYMLSAIVQKLTGQRVIDYLRPRLFEPLHIRHISAETCPRGIDTGSFGLSATTEAVAKLAQLYLRKGRWNGRQVLSQDWVEQATSTKIVQPATFLAAAGTSLEELRRTSDWHQGYGYQFWRCRHDAFRGDGAFGQLCVVMPHEDAVLAITSRSPKMQGLLDLVWEHLLPATRGIRADEIGAGIESALKRKLASATLPLPSGDFESAAASKISGREFVLESNSLGAEKVTFKFGGDFCAARLRQNGVDHQVRCGFGRWLNSVSGGAFAPYRLEIFGNAVLPSEANSVAGAAAWQEPNHLALELRYFETPFADDISCRFDGDRITIEFLNSFAKQRLAAYPTLARMDVEKRPALRGRLVS